MKGSNMIMIYVLSIVYAFLISFVLRFLVIPQTGALDMIGGDPSKALPSYQTFMTDYSAAFRTFKHVTQHGFMTGLFMILPITGVNALYERRRFNMN